MLLLLQFMLAVGKSTRVSVLALAFLYPLFAKLCLDLKLVVLRQNSAVTFEGEGHVGLHLDEKMPGIGPTNQRGTSPIA